MPLTTQPPFQPLLSKYLQTSKNSEIDFLILRFDTDDVNLSPNQSPAGPSKAQDWQKTQYANLIRYVPSGTYFARLRVSGKLIVRSLKTRTLTVAKLKLADLEKELRSQAESGVKLTEGAVPFDELLAEYRERLKRNHTIKQRSRDYREECIKRILKSWPQLSGTDVRKIAQDDCEEWAGRFVSGTSPTAFNNTVGTLRQILQIAVEKGIRYTNPASSIKRTRIRQRQLVLPSQEQFAALVTEIRKVPYGPGLASAELVEFLAFGGFRKSEARHITWADCDFVREEIVVRGDPVSGTKNSLVRRVPMIPEMRQLLETLRSQRPDAVPGAKVMRVAECQGALTRACKALGIHRITHHDLRHLFATRCIESGVDIPTVSRWLGHKDGGALAMKTYGHLRDEHSVSMAKRVRFAAAPHGKETAESSGDASSRPLS